jgi:hypothetical protein
MTKNTTLVLSLLLQCVSIVQAQYVLKENLNIPRIGDGIIKQQVEFKGAGRVGENVIWNFSNLELLGDNYGLIYLPPLQLSSGDYLMGNDTFNTSENLLMCHEYKTNYFYEIRDSILFLLGHQNSMDIMKHLTPVPYLKFPMYYGEKLEYNTRSKDIFSKNTPLFIRGYFTMDADAYGILILPTGDTLKQVLRIHTIHKQLSDSVKEMNYIHVNTITENYRWYARGLRYPVFESIHITHKNGDNEDVFKTSFMYQPQQKNNDTANIAEQKRMKKELEQQNSDLWAGMTYNVYPNPVRSDLNFELYLPKVVNNLHIQVHTPMGLVAIDRNMGGYSQGLHKFTFNVSGLRPNTHYVLDFWLDGYLVKGIVILKK